MTQRFATLMVDLDFSSDEKSRLSLSFKERSGVQFEIISKYYQEIKTNEFWIQIHSIMRIDGYRPGKAKEIVLKRCLDSVGESSKANLCLWRLYRRCALLHIDSEYKNLNDLLLKEDVTVEDPRNTDIVFKELIRLSPLYSVSEKEIRHLYDIWGFKRIENFEDLFSQQKSDVEIIRRLIDQKLTEKETALRATVSNQFVKTEQEIKEINNEFDKLKTDLSNLDKKFALSSAVIRGELQNYAASAVEKGINEVSSELRKSIAKKNPEIELHREILKMSDQISHLSKRIESIQSVASKNAPASIKKEQTYRDGILDLSEMAKTIKFLADDEAHRVMAVIICCLKSSNIVISESYDEIKPILEKSYNASQIRAITANPLWIDRSDWQDHISFIEEDRAQPRVLVIHDFDLPLQEIYLIPTLVSWQRGKFLNGDKVVLIRSNSVNHLSGRFFELGIAIPSANELNDFLNLVEVRKFDMVKFGDLLKSSLVINIDPGIRKVEEEIRQLAKNSTIHLSGGITATFGGLYSCLKFFMDEASAFRLSLKLTILNWVEIELGEAKMRILDERISAIILRVENG